MYPLLTGKALEFLKKLTSWQEKPKSCTHSIPVPHTKFWNKFICNILNISTKQAEASKQ